MISFGGRTAIKLPVSPVARMGDLSTHEQQLISIGRAMTQGVKVLILDEPTASLTERETELLFERIADLHSHGVTTIYISHRLHEFERIANVVTVMRDGAVVDHFRLEGTRDTPRRVIRAMVGRDLTEMYPKVAAPVGAPVLALRDWSVANPVAGRLPLVRNVNLTVSAGEVVGIFGLLGSGTFALARSIFGSIEGAASGGMEIMGAPVSIDSPRAAIRHGIAYLPAERKRDGLIAGHSIESNMSLAALAGFSRYGFIDRKAELPGVQRIAARLRVKCTSMEQPIRQLSGGNQQKVVAAKWLLSEPKIFVLEEPRPFACHHQCRDDLAQYGDAGYLGRVAAAAGQHYRPRCILAGILTPAMTRKAGPGIGRRTGLIRPSRLVSRRVGRHRGTGCHDHLGELSRHSAAGRAGAGGRRDHRGMLRYTAFGRRLYAIGGNRQAALLAGIDIRKHITIVFVAMGALYGLAGLMLVARLSSAPPTAGQGLELNVIAAAVIGGTSLLGGRGTVTGAAVGALLMESLANGMSLMNLPTSYQSIAVGLVLLFAVFVDVRGRGSRGDD